MTGGFKYGERGAALLSALLLVTLVAAIGVAVVDDIRFAIHRTANARERDQALRYAAGAEALARQIIWRSWKAQPNRSTLTDPWARDGVSFAIDGGSISGGIRDAGNCLNLNALGGPPGTEEADLASRQFQTLAETMGLQGDGAEALAAAIADWIDADAAPRPRGAEDGHYMRLDPPYRAGNTLMADVSELRAVRGMSADIYLRLRPLLCARPTTSIGRININTLASTQAPLLVMLFGEGLSLAAAVRIIETRPLSGYARVEDFLATRELSSLQIADAVRAQLGVSTRHFAVETRVTYASADVGSSVLLDLDDSGRLSVAARRIGDGE
ncbi:MAG: type II secretion system minor pseudopilin GspK [Rhodospirillaceae bacterium]|nr:type II secretion system minor pseudopilin GspK [Rhodospirillaceae bacterium]